VRVTGLVGAIRCRHIGAGFGVGAGRLLVGLGLDLGLDRDRVLAIVRDGDAALVGHGGRRVGGGGRACQREAAREGEE
jgi:hypothetical protein